MTARPTPQGVNHPTFHAAPFDHGLSLPGLYEYHAKHSPTHAVFSYVDPETNEVHDVTYADAWEKIGAVARIVERNYAASTAKKADGSRPVIAVLAISDALSYIFLEVAIMSLGYTAFPLSPRNVSEITAHLLEKTGGAQLYASADAAMQGLAKGAVEILEKKGVTVDLLPMIAPSDWQSPAEAYMPAAVVEVAETDVAVILHSSGTTGFPKPIPITRKGLINLSNIPCFGEVDLAGKRVAAHTNPIFHAMGLATMIWPVSSGSTFALYAPQPSPKMPTPANFLADWIACKCDIVFCIPAFIEAWARDPANLPSLQALDCILTPQQVFSGAPINKAIGDALAKAGVTLHPFWGSTEVGPATMFIPRDPPPSDEWEYFKFSHHITFRLEPQEGLPGIIEPIMVTTELCFPHVTNAERDGERVFAVGDLLEQHPTDPDRWKVFGRVDDQIALSTAKKINPVPYEGILAHDPNIASALVFGNQRLEPGLLVEPAAGVVIPAGDAQALEEYKDLIWPAVEKANAQTASYAHVKREMILVASPEKPLEHTPKGTPRRGVCLRLYQSEIDALYAAHADAAPELREFPDRR
ncbi:acetyl-CoA synthetase-like protein [Trametes gibbosa]|nr:acetyl-CoA synthetase-like protein [Trametes gibbosa]